MGISLAQLLLILIVVLILFGAGRLPQVMEQLGKGVKNFKDSLKGDNNNKNEKED